MKMTTKSTLFSLFGAVLVLSLLGSSAGADVSVQFAYTSGPADVRVWLERTDAYIQYEDDYDYYETDYEDDVYYDEAYDVYPTTDGISLFVRTSRSSYVTVYVVDTDGFIHVVHPLSPQHSAYLRGHRVYRFSLNDVGFVDPRGIAYAYAVTSPVPFSYASYGIGVFGNNFAFQIYGDPYVGSRRFYGSIVPRWCEPRLVGVSYARFYIGEYVRYPSYLCVGWHDYYGVRKYCRRSCSVYTQYKIHARDPYRVIHPTRTVARDARDYTKITRTKHAADWTPLERESKRIVPKQVQSNRAGVRSKVVAGKDRSVKRTTKPVPAPIVTRSTQSNRGKGKVLSSKDSYIRSKEKISSMRRQLEKKNFDKRTSVGKSKKNRKNADVQRVHTTKPSRAKKANPKKSTVQRTNKKRVGKKVSHAKG